MVLTLSGILNKLGDNFGTDLFSNSAAAQTKVIILCPAPVTPGVMLIIHTAALIFLLQTCFGSLLRFAVQPHDPVGTVILIGINKDVQNILT